MSGSPRSSRHLWLRAGLYALAVVAISNLLVRDEVGLGVLAPLREAIARAAAGVLSLLGTAATAQGDHIRMPGGAVQVVDACTGLDASLLVGAAVLVFPAGWRARLLGVLAGFAILMPLNFIRVVTLAYG
jgi:exosortase/archaeosortase